MHVVYANCFGAPDADLLLTDEVAVAEAFRGDAVLADRRYDAGVAQALNARMAQLAHSWAVVDGEDPTLAGGVSAADLAGMEALITILLPAARAVLEIGAAAPAEAARFTVVAPSGGDPGFDAVEGVIADAASAAVRARGAEVERVTASDPRNAALAAKYSLTRNPRVLGGDPWREVVLGYGAAAVINVASRLRGPGGRRALIMGYHPTTAFARRYRAEGGGELGLVRLRFAAEDVGPTLRAGDRAMVPLRTPGPRGEDRRVVERLQTFAAAHEDVLRDRFRIEGVDLWEVCGPRLIALAGRYASWARLRGRYVRRALRAARVAAVLLPYETPAEARLVLRLAQAEGIPTLTLNDGWKGDAHQTEGMAADRALAWSEGIAQRYFARRDGGRPTIVTGNPRADSPLPPARPAPPAALRRVLVGSFTFSPSDLNCRRSDPERFLGEVLDGIRASSRARGAHVLVKLHPADYPEAYRTLLDRYADLDVELRRGGDIVDLFDDSDLYVCTYSTSMLEGAAVGLPFVYYRVNDQRFDPPFSGDDPITGPRTASTPSELTRLVDDPASLDLGDRAAISAWIEHHLGPHDGRAAERVAAALEQDARSD